MHSESIQTRKHARKPTLALGALLFGALLALTASPARAEDPLLGQIKVIKCVGCDPGSVNLVVHDPIVVRDFEVQIKESDYQKIVTPLAGKTIYDKEGCFYWMDMPKATAKPAAKDAPGAKGQGPKKAAADSSKDGVLETSAPPASPEIEGKPSRCIPYVKIEPKPTHIGGKKEEE